MTLDIRISQFSLPVDPYAAFQTAYQRKLLELFRQGATLFLWRGTCPHNYYIETPDGQTSLIVEGDRESCEANSTGSAQREALARLARPVFKSPRVISGGSRCENGLPEQEGWLFDAELARKYEQQWAAFQAELALRTANRKTVAPALDQLSELALALLRLLKTDDFVRPWDPERAGLFRSPELTSAFAELDDQGLVELTPAGRFALVPAATALRVPRGPRLRFV